VANSIVLKRVISPGFISLAEAVSFKKRFSDLDSDFTKSNKSLFEIKFILVIQFYKIIIELLFGFTN
jgi:hypothetical protein